MGGHQGRHTAKLERDSRRRSLPGLAELLPLLDRQIRELRDGYMQELPERLRLLLQVRAVCEQLSLVHA